MRILYNATSITCNAALSACGKREEWSTAVELFARAQRRFSPSLITFNALIGTCHWRRSLGDAITCSSAISSVDTASWPKALGLFGEMPLVLQDAPSHAGCFVKNGTTMLAVKLTYDGNLFDIPGGRTDGHEPATRTAERETFEESGYQVSIGELLATLRNYRKGPDHEVSMVKWMDVGEIEGHLQHHDSLVHGRSHGTAVAGPSLAWRHLVGLRPVLGHVRSQ
eukprot:g25482.t2